MCQQYEAERRYLVAAGAFESEQGWAAHRDGLPRDADGMTPWRKEGWLHGYDCRASGGVIPWVIVEKFRKQRGTPYGGEPTREQADALV